MSTLMKQRRQIRALARLEISPYSKLDKKASKEMIKKAERLGRERDVLIRATQNVDVYGLSHRLNRGV